MRTWFKIALIFFCLCAFASNLVGRDKYYAFPFIGKWQPAEDPALIEEYGFRDIQNLRKDGKRLKGVSGHTKISTSVPTTSFSYIRNGYHFTKDQPSESHILVWASNSLSLSSSSLFQSTTAIPDAGNFLGPILYENEADSDIGRFCAWPGGNVAYCNGNRSMIWGGDELKVTSVITSSHATTFADPADYTDAAQNLSSEFGDYFTLGGYNNSYCILYLRFEGTPSSAITDESTGGAGETAEKIAGAKVNNGIYHIGNGALYLDGVGDTIKFSDNSLGAGGVDVAFSSGDFTFDFWVWVNEHGASTPFYQHYDDDDNYVYLVYDAANTRVEFDSEVGGVTRFNQEFTTVIGTKQWYHLRFVRDGDAFKLYKNGQWVSTVTDSDDYPNIAGEFFVGSEDVGADTDFNGYIDEFAAWKGLALTTDSSFEVPHRSFQSKPYLFVGSTRPIEGIKARVLNPNMVASLGTAAEWQGGAWVEKTTTDGTRTGGIAMAQDGSITFSCTTDTSRPRIAKDEFLYWYRYYLDDGAADIYSLTVDATWQDVVNIWDGEGIQPLQVEVYDGGRWEDYTAEARTDGFAQIGDATYYQDVVELTTLANTEYMYLCFPERVSAIKFNLIAEAYNSTATVVSIYYWSNGGWSGLKGIQDGTLVGANSLAQSGWMYWNDPGQAQEERDSRFGGVNGYWYKFAWDQALSNPVLVNTIVGAKAIDTIGGFKFPFMFQNRAFLCCEEDGAKNGCCYSMSDAPDVWNGNDSGWLYFGDDKEVVAAAVIYNVFRTSGFEQALVCKHNQTFRVFGDGPENWEVQQMSGNVGCAAPLSMAVCEVADISEGTTRNVAIWQTDHGVVMCDGATIVDISKDIANYWDANSSDCIPADRMDDSVAWYNPNLHTYTLLISSGSSQDTHNVELEYSVKYKEWTKLYRENASGANPLQCGFQVHDTTGNTYIYGCTDEGYMYRLENGNLWENIRIRQYVWTKNLYLDDELPYFRHTVVNGLRLAFEDKAASGAEDISILHYCDDSATNAAGLLNQILASDMSMSEGPHEYRSCNLGPCLEHSFYISADVSTVADGMELTGLGLLYTPLETIRE